MKQPLAKKTSRRQMFKQIGQAGLGLATITVIGLASRNNWLESVFGHAPSLSALPSFRLRELSRQAKMAVTHQKVLLDHQIDNVMPWMSSVGAAVSAADYNNDGLIDIFVSSSGRNAPCHLFRNNGDGTFTDVAEQAGIAHLNQEGGVMDAVWGDFNNDGWPDLYYDIL